SPPTTAVTGVIIRARTAWTLTFHGSLRVRAYAERARCTPRSACTTRARRRSGCLASATIRRWRAARCARRSRDRPAAPLQLRHRLGEDDAPLPQSRHDEVVAARIRSDVLGR